MTAVARLNYLHGVRDTIESTGRRALEEVMLDKIPCWLLLVAASACPESGRGQAIRVEIYDE